MALADVRTSAGSTLSISATPPATYDEAGFEALTFTKVSWISNMGEFAKVFNLVTFNPLDTRQTIKRKGSYDNGSMSLELARDGNDAGQTLLRTAADSDISPAFEVVLQDGSTFYFTAQVMSANIVVGSVDDITMSNVNLEIDNDVIEAA